MTTISNTNNTTVNPPSTPNITTVSINNNTTVILPSNPNITAVRITETPLSIHQVRRTNHSFEKANFPTLSPMLNIIQF
jgi:hypothetical protein